MATHKPICSIFWLINLSFFLSPTSANNPFFIFGDTILDPGNSNYLYVSSASKANFPPYGISFFDPPTGRFSDGRLVSDFLANHANLSFIPPFYQPDKHQFYDGVSFASSDSGILDQISQNRHTGLYGQLKNYRSVYEWFRHELGDSVAKQKIAEAVYFFSSSGKDYAHVLSTNSSTTYSKSEVVDKVVGGIADVLKEVYNTGGRKFMLVNIPSIGCFPGYRGLTTDGSCFSEGSSYAVIHNEALRRTLKALEEQLPGFKYYVYDLYSSMQQILDHPIDFGYKETEAACCGSGKFRGEFSCGRTTHYDLCENRNEYLFWDPTHFTEKFNQRIADEMWNNIHSYGSTTVKNFFTLP